MEDDFVSILISLVSFGFFIILFIAVGFIIFLGIKRKLKIRFNPMTGRIDLFINKQKIGDVSKSEIKEIRLSDYQVKSSKSTKTYFAYSVVLEEESLNRIRSLNPQLEKLETDSDKIGFRLDTSVDEIFIRKQAENLCKELGIPLRNREGDLRQSLELDIPYHELMKGNIELGDFPPLFKTGDPFSVKIEGQRLNFISYEKNYLIYIPLGFILFITSLFFIASGGYELFYIEESDPVLFGFAILFNSPFIFSLIFALYIAYRIHFPKEIKLEKGILKYGFMKIPINEIEEVNFNIFFLKILTDRRVYTIFIPFLAKMQNLKECAELIKKCIVYQGIR